jgi:hypothetical protein
VQVGKEEGLFFLGEGSQNRGGRGFRFSVCGSAGIRLSAPTCDFPARMRWAWWDDTSIYFSKNMKIVSSTSLKKMLF